MAVKRFKAYTPSRRNMTVSAFDEITKKTPEKSLLAKKKEKAGVFNYTMSNHEGVRSLNYGIYHDL